MTLILPTQIDSCCCLTPILKIKIYRVETAIPYTRGLFNSIGINIKTECVYIKSEPNEDLREYNMIESEHNEDVTEGNMIESEPNEDIIKQHVKTEFIE